MQMRGTIKGIPLVYLGYYYSGKEGAVQIITFTGEGLFTHTEDFEELLNGFDVAK